MSSLRVVSLAVMAVLAFAAPAMATGTNNRQASCSPQNYLGNFTPAQALAELSSHWDQGVTLTTGTDEQIIAAFRAGIQNNSAMTSDMAEIIAAGRPELLEQLRAAVTGVCPAAVTQVMQNAQQAANNPTPEQLASIAQEEGTAPAAGGDEGDPLDTFDQALNDGSPE